MAVADPASGHSRFETQSKVWSLDTGLIFLVNCYYLQTNLNK